MQLKIVLVLLLAAVGGKLVEAKRGLASVPDFCEGIGRLDTLEDLFSSAFARKFGGRYHEARPSVISQNPNQS